MVVPEEIRKVERPRGTVVCDGRDGTYPVREKLSGESWVDDDGKRHRPSRNGRVVGHIINGTFVPKDLSEHVSTCDVDLKNWGQYEICERLNTDLLTDLQTVYAQQDAVKLFSMAVIRCLNRGVSDRLIGRFYDESFLSEHYGDLKLGRTAIGTFLRNVGRSYSKIVLFMRRRVSAAGADDCLIIDGTIKQDHSKINSLSEVSRKTCHTKHKDMLLLYCYGAESKEPLCCKAYPGNMIDMRAVSDFIEENGITAGTIIADKGFPVSSIEDEVLKHKELHYILPLKRNDSSIAKHSMYAFNSKLNDSREISCRKAGAIKDGRKVWYYSFRDPVIAQEEEILYLKTKGSEDIDSRELASARREFGTLVFESDLNMEPKQVYSYYEDRWQIELMFRFERDILEMDDTREHSDYTAIASEFVDFLAAIMSARMFKYFDGKGFLEKMTYADVIRRLDRFKMVKVTEDGVWRVNRAPAIDAEFAVTMELLVRPIVPKVVKTKGRPKGSKDKKPRKRRSKVESETSSE